MAKKRSTPDLATKNGLEIKPLEKSRPKSRPDSRKVLHAEFKQFKAQHMVPFMLSYKPAALYTGKSYWYIYYYYRNPLTDKYERFKEYFDINRIHDRKQRRIYGQEAVKFINQKLIMGFNPFKAIAQLQDGGTIINKLDLLYTELTAYANDGTKSYYSTQVNRFKEFLKHYELEDITIGSISTLHAENFKKWMQDKKLAKKTINVNLSYISKFWSQAIKMNLVAADPFEAVERIKKDVRYEDDQPEDVYEPITFEELKCIVNAVKQCETPNFLTALMCIYYAWIRPKEVRKLQLKDIDLTSQFIRMRKGNTKSDKGAYVQIVKPLLDLLGSVDLNQYKPSDYLFSENYVPGPKPMHRLKMSRLWLKIVKKGLKIDKNMYALKHTGNIEYLLQNKGNVDLKWMQMQNRHSSTAMTEKYIRQLGAYFIDIEKVKFREL